MIKLKDILNEISLNIKRPSQYSIIAITELDGAIEFDLDGITYHLSFYCRDNPYEDDIDYTIPRLSLSFSTAEKIHTKKETELTNANIPFKLLSNLFGCVEIWAENYKKKFVHGGKNLTVTSIYFKPAKENKEDTRREKIYLEYFKQYAKLKNTSMTSTKTIGGIHCLFDPDLKW